MTESDELRILRVKVNAQSYEIERPRGEMQARDKQYERHGLEDIRTIEALEAELEGIKARISSGELVEVVRCKDCVYSRPAEDYAIYYCDKGIFGLMGGSAYCSLGKRRGGSR